MYQCINNSEHNFSLPQLPLPRDHLAIDDGAVHTILHPGDAGGVPRHPAAPLQDLCLPQLHQNHQEYTYLLFYYCHVDIQVYKRFFL